MELREQVKYLRKTRGLKQRQVAKLTGISFDMYTKFESGARNMNYMNLEKVMQVLNGTLCVVPYRFEQKELEAELVNNEHGPNGVTRLDTVREIERLFNEMPNLLSDDEIVSQSKNAVELYMKDLIGRQALAGYRKSCEERYIFYKEKENYSKEFYEDYTTSLEMLVIDILRKMCSVKEFHEVPDLVEQLLED
jgi:transcriptional regulator with XRE-family HTH domain